MKPVQIARMECANFQDGHCAGLGIADDGRTVRFRPAGPCLLFQNKPCQYFEECVLPMKEPIEPKLTRPKTAGGYRQSLSDETLAAWEQAKYAYRRSAIPTKQPKRNKNRLNAPERPQEGDLASREAKPV